jgi:hypothetical protein
VDRAGLGLCAVAALLLAVLNIGVQLPEISS